MELPLHVVTDDYGGQGWVVRIVDHKAVIQFEAVVGPNEDHNLIATRADFICTAVNNHKRLMEKINALCQAITLAEDYLSVMATEDLNPHAETLLKVHTGAKRLLKELED